jgi:hypothetical protein
MLYVPIHLVDKLRNSVNIIIWIKMNWQGPTTQYLNIMKKTKRTSGLNCK